MGTAEAATCVLDAAGRRPPRLGGSCRVVAVDGQAGAGKTTLAAAVAALAAERGRRAAVVPMDDLYDGWRGVLTVHAHVDEMLRALHTRSETTYRRYDWHREQRAEEHRLTLPDLLVLEGVGASHPAYDDLVTLRVWVEAPTQLRLRRGLARDGEHLAGPWRRFLADEQVVHARDRTRERADVHVDGVAGRVRTLALDLREPR